jgi:hypothetical protein
MKNVSKLVVGIGLLSLLSLMPLGAQIDNGVNFTTSFPFYAGNAKLPAGSYKITQSDMDESILQIRSKDGVHSALIGDTEYLKRIWVQGQKYKPETKAAANANVVEHSLYAS